MELLTEGVCGMVKPLERILETAVRTFTTSLSEKDRVNSVWSAELLRTGELPGLRRTRPFLAADAAPLCFLRTQGLLPQRLAEQHPAAKLPRQSVRLSATMVDLPYLGLEVGNGCKKAGYITNSTTQEHMSGSETSDKRNTIKREI